jgi:hypothetical protein
MRKRGQPTSVRSIVLLAAVALASCGDDAASSTTSERAASGPAGTSGAIATVDGPVLRYPQRVSGAEELAAPVRGVLQLEGSCLYVFNHESAQRYPVVWPAGAQWDDADESVVSPLGEQMPIGSRVVGGGGFFSVADVERIAGSAASALASQCLDNTTDEIAVVNNTDSAIGPTQN